MTALSSLMSLGFRIPETDERDEIMGEFSINAASRNLSSSEERLICGAVMNVDGVPELTSIGTDGVVCRFLKLTPSQVIERYNIPNFPSGYRAVPRLEPARCFFNDKITQSLILYANTGHIIICEDEANFSSGKFVDPMVQNHGTGRTKPVRIRSSQRASRAINPCASYFCSGSIIC
jgi:hypothetical protein